MEPRPGSFTGHQESEDKREKSLSSPSYLAAARSHTERRFITTTNVSRPPARNWFSGLLSFGARLKSRVKFIGSGFDTERKPGLNTD